jgi:MSHA biogenesis protein MshM
MYLDHFGLTEPPFGITPDTAFAFSARSHQEALNTLLLALAGGEGFIKITGEVGTGKTMLCRRLLANLGAGYLSAYVPNPYLDPRGLFAALAEEIGIAIDAGADQHRLLKTINHALMEHAAADCGVVLCLDEAQALPLETLEALRLLSNLETEKRKLLHVVLFAQPELDDRLAQPSARQLRQRIAFSYRLEGLARGEIEHYLDHRLRVAGYRGGALFSRGAARLLARASGGIPRLINILAHKSLLAAYGDGAQPIRRRHVAAAARDSSEARWRPFGILRRLRMA